MEKKYLIKGVLFVMAGLAFFTSAVLSETVLDGLLWGFGGAFFAPGLVRIINFVYWSLPRNAERYREIREQEEINLHDELNEKLRDKSGRITYLIGMAVICISMVTFSILGKAGVITGHKILVLYLYGLFVFQIVAGIAVYNYLRKKY